MPRGEPIKLAKAIAAWDGKSAADIAAVFQSHCTEPHYVENLIQLMGSSDSQKGASWLLKAWFDRGKSITDKQTSNILSRLSALESWEAKLHILQCFPFISIKDNQKVVVEKFLRSTLSDNNKFVRAWSYNGFYVLAKQHAEYQEETQRFFAMAMKDESASVKARIRNLMKTGF